MGWSVLVWVPPEADPETRIHMQVVYLEDKGSTIITVGK